MRSSDTSVLEEVVSALPPPSLDDATVDAMRVRLVAEARTTRQRSRVSYRWIAAVAVAASSAALGIAVERIRTDSPAEPPTAKVIIDAIAGGPARRMDTDLSSSRQTWRVDDGRFLVDVPLLPTTELLLLAGASELWSEHSRFEVLVRNGRLEHVDVLNGLVHLRRANGERLVVRGGETWKRPADAAPSALPPEPESSEREQEKAPPRRSRPAAESKPTVAKPTEISPTVETAFEQGWRAFRAGDYDAAADGFERARARGGSIAEDATYWLAVTELRRSRDDEAAELLRDFLQRYATSRRAVEAKRLLERAVSPRP